MNKQEIYKLRPLTPMCGILCTATFVLAFLLILCGITESIIQFILIGIIFAMINAILVIFSVWKWNSFVFIDNEKITQYQWGKEITIFYNEIEKIKYFYWRDEHKYEPRITVCSNEKKITFGKIYVLPKFLERCSSEKVKNEISAKINNASRRKYRFFTIN